MSEQEMALPPRGLPPESILKIMESYRGGDARWKAGKTWSLVYFIDEARTEFLKQAHNMFFSENALNPLAFQSLKRFEHEVVRMTATLLNGDRHVAGTMSAGGTESILLAVKTYRDRARKQNRHLTTPEMILPESAHVAFLKAAHYFDVKPVSAPLTPDFKVDISAVEKLISKNTILLVGSSPNYPFGTIDPIEELGGLALRHGLPLHVDACLGGFLLPFLEKAGRSIPPFDFRVPGVTSLSADVHKYGYAAKGASVILYRNMDYLKYQFFIEENWPGGVFASPGLLGTRPGGPIAAAWAAMQVLGEGGYLKNAAKTMEATKTLLNGIAQIPELEILGKPPMSVFAFRSKSKQVNIYAVGDLLEKKGWHIDRQQRPESLHAMVIPPHAGITDEYLADLREAVVLAKNTPKLATQGSAAMYGMLANIPWRGMIKKNVLELTQEMYGPEGTLPDFEGGSGTRDLATRMGQLFLKVKEAWGRFLEKLKFKR